MVGGRGEGCGGSFAAVRCHSSAAWKKRNPEVPAR